VLQLCCWQQGLKMDASIFNFKVNILGLAGAILMFFVVLKLAMAVLHFAAGSKVINWVPKANQFSVGLECSAQKWALVLSNFALH